MLKRYNVIKFAYIDDCEKVSLQQCNWHTNRAVYMKSGEEEHEYC